MSKVITSFEALVKYFQGLNVNENTEKKGNLTYLSWAWAWQEVLKVCPDATYEVLSFTNKETGDVLPYQSDPTMGIMVWTRVTMLGQTKLMWLPVMDSKNNAMLLTPQTITKFNKSITIPAANMFDVNKTIMRCLVKNLAMFGLGTYIYAGEDLPEAEKVVVQQQKEQKEKEKKEASLIAITTKHERYPKVKAFVERAASKGAEHVLSQLETKYKISPAFEKHVRKLIEEAAS